MEWTTEKVLWDLGKIRKLKTVSEAYMENGYLKVVTKGLKHPKALFGIAKIMIRIPLYEDTAEYKHISHSIWRGHPVLKRMSTSYQGYCTGGYRDDYYMAREHGPLMTVIQQLTMLQTIQSADARDNWTAMDTLVLCWVVLMLGLVIITLAIH